MCRPLGIEDTFCNVPADKLPRLVSAYLLVDNNVRKVQAGETLTHRLWAYDTLWKEAGGTARALAICGWDPAKKQLVETEYWTGGGTNTLRYSKTNDTLWEGTMSGVEADGKELTGKIAYEIKSPTHLVFRATDVKVGGEPRKDIEISYFKK